MMLVKEENRLFSSRCRSVSQPLFFDIDASDLFLKETRLSTLLMATLIFYE